MNNIKNFENFNNKDIFYFITNNDIQSVKNYIDSGYDLNIQDNDGDTPLIKAAYKNNIDIEIVRFLLNSSADIDINKQNNKKNTALIVASIYNNIKVVELLLNYDVYIDHQGEFSYTALINAAFYNNTEIVKLLLNSGADLNKQNNYGYTALILAVMYNNLEIVELLLNAGADIDKQTNGGDTALIFAAKNNNRKIIKPLLDYGADEFILDYYGKSFYDYLNDKDKQYFLKEYPTSVYNAIYHNYKKSFTEFVKDHNIKIKK